MFQIAARMVGPGMLWRAAKTVLAVAVALASVLFLASTFRGSWGELSALAVDRQVLAATLLLSVAYGVIFFIMFGAWYYTLRHNSPARVPFAPAAYAYSLCNIAKYLPGSVFHFAGRQILGARLGWSHASIARATLLEIGAMACGVCLTVLAIAVSPAGGPAIDTVVAHLGMDAADWRSPAILAIAAGLVILLPLWRIGAANRIFGVSLASVLVVVALSMLFFASYAAMAVIFVRQLAVTAPAPDMAWIAIAFLLSWLVGFIVPGAPGGIGVRESMLVLLLAGSGDSGNAIALALGLGMRCVNTLGDLVFAAIAYALRRLTSPEPALASPQGE